MVNPDGQEVRPEGEEPEARGDLREGSPGATETRQEADPEATESDRQGVDEQGDNPGSTSTSGPQGVLRVARKRPPPPCHFARIFDNATSVAMFRTNFHIPYGVEVTLLNEGLESAHERGNFIVPLMAIVEGGVRFPLHPVLREILFRTNLTTSQLTINSYRIIMSYIKLMETKPELQLDLATLFGIYYISKSADGVYYLSCRPVHGELFIEQLAEKDVWQEVYVVVSGPIAPGEPANRTTLGEYSAAAVQSLFALRDQQKVEAAFRLPVEERLAPKLLGFTPHYKHFLRKKAPKAPATANQPSSSQAAASHPIAGQTAARRSTAGRSRGDSRRRRRSMGRDEPEDLVAARQPVARSRGRGRSGAPTARQQAPPFVQPSASLGRSPTSPSAKRQKVTEEAPSGGGSQLSPDEAAEQQATKVIDLDAEAGQDLEREALNADPGAGSGSGSGSGPGKRPWAPAFQAFGGRPITEADSAKEDVDVAFGLLRATRLPRDKKRLPNSMEYMIAEMGQLSIELGNRALGLVEARRSEVQEKKQIRQQLADITTSCNAYSAEVCEMQKKLDAAEDERDRALQDRDNALEEARKAREEMAKLKSDLALQLKEAGDAGYNEALQKVTANYKGQIKQIEELRHTASYSDGWYEGQEHLLAKLDLPDDSELRTISEPPAENLVLFPPEEQQPIQQQQEQRQEQHQEQQPDEQQQEKEQEKEQEKDAEGASGP